MGELNESKEYQVNWRIKDVAFKDEEKIVMCEIRYMVYAKRQSIIDKTIFLWYNFVCNPTAAKIIEQIESSIQSEVKQQLDQIRLKSQLMYMKKTTYVTQ